jgi:hypothetical protein
MIDLFLSFVELFLAYLAPIAIIGVVCHIADEQRTREDGNNFHVWYNDDVFKTYRWEFPLSRVVNLWRNTVGLGIGLIGLVIVGYWGSIPAALAVFWGFVVADSIIHLVLSLVVKEASPGWVTSLLVYAPIAAGGWHLGWASHHGGVSIGALLIISTYAIDYFRTWRWRR